MRVPCPLHLPPHVHSDQLSELVIKVSGCSRAGKHLRRWSGKSFEHGAAHNVLQLGLSFLQERLSGLNRWRGWFSSSCKAQPRHRQSGVLGDASCFAAGSHDGFDRWCESRTSCGAEQCQSPKGRSQRRRCGLNPSPSSFQAVVAFGSRSSQGMVRSAGV